MDIRDSVIKFKKYAHNFDFANKDIERKYFHSFRVKSFSEQIAKKLYLDNEKIKLSSFIGLFHDIGRFEQLKQFSTFNDYYSFDHGNFGAEYLKENLRFLVDTDEFDDIIIQSVKNHNKFRIASGLNDDELFYSKLVRDADKLDILFESTSIFWEGKEDIINNSSILDYSYDCIKNHSLVEYKKGMKLENLDSIIKVLAFVFDFNYTPSFQILKNNDYINKILGRYRFNDATTKKRICEIQDIINSFIDSKLEQ
ncbi:MAG: HD domain-containing protein [Clostridia bacterium]|nr:HD domain-containing protein [Clostridia bacterium]